jgi:transposase
MEDSGGRKRKQHALSLEKKQEIIEAEKEEKNRTKLAERFGVPRTTIIGVLNSKDDVLKAIDDGSSGKRKRLTPGRMQQLEEALVVWFKQVRSEDVPVTGELLQVGVTFH